MSGTGLDVRPLASLLFPDTCERLPCRTFRMMRIDRRIGIGVTRHLDSWKFATGFAIVVIRENFGSRKDRLTGKYSQHWSRSAVFLLSHVIERFESQGRRAFTN